MTMPRRFNFWMRMHSILVGISLRDMKKREERIQRIWRKRPDKASSLSLKKQFSQSYPVVSVKIREIRSSTLLLELVNKRENIRRPNPNRRFPR